MVCVSRSCGCSKRGQRRGRHSGLVAQDIFRRRRHHDQRPGILCQLRCGWRRIQQFAGIPGGYGPDQQRVGLSYYQRHPHRRQSARHVDDGKRQDQRLAGDARRWQGELLNEQLYRPLHRDQYGRYRCQLLGHRGGNEHAGRLLPCAAGAMTQSDTTPWMVDYESYEISQTTCRCPSRPRVLSGCS